MTVSSYALLADAIIDKRCPLTHLCLEGNNMGDASIAEICYMVERTFTMLVVNLSKCNISDLGAEYLGHMLESDDLKLRALILHWNNIKGRGSAALAKAIKYNHTLQIFDASFNNFGSSNLARKV